MIDLILQVIIIIKISSRWEYYIYFNMKTRSFKTISFTDSGNLLKGVFFREEKHEILQLVFYKNV